MTSTTSCSESIMSDDQWSTEAVDGSEPSSPASESSFELDLAEQDQDDATKPPVIRITPPPSAAAAPPTPTLFDPSNPPLEQDTFSIETFEDDEEDLYSELETALAEDFIPACLRRMESFVEDFDTVFNQT